MKNKIISINHANVSIVPLLVVILFQGKIVFSQKQSKNRLYATESLKNKNRNDKAFRFLYDEGD